MKKTNTNEIKTSKKTKSPKTTKRLADNSLDKSVKVEYKYHEMDVNKVLKTLDN